TFLSSNGGNFASPTTFVASEDFSFSGSEWTNVQWLLISGGPGFPLGIDNLVLNVAEPGTLALALLSFIGLGVNRRPRLERKAHHG
ncbi:MAG TPA: hypothetical protein VF524_02800, partial [Polyangia bacterium]